MTNLQNGVKILPKMSIAWVGRTNVTDRRQTDRQTTDGRTTTYSEHELEFTFAKNKNKLQKARHFNLVMNGTEFVDKSVENAYDCDSRETEKK